MNDIKEEIYKCSKCGLCKSVCPVFLSLKNEMYSPRGRYIVLNAQDKLSKKFVKELDICLNCSECKSFCPSSIDSSKIFNILKSKHDRKLIKFSFLYKLFLLYKLLFKKSSKRTLKKGSIVYFSGCYNNYINNDDENAVIDLIENNGYGIKKIIRNCCGYPYLNEGNFEAFDKNIKKIINSLPDDYDYIVCSCDSCYETLKRIPDKKFTQKLIRIDELIKTDIKSDTDYLYFKPLLRQTDCALNEKISTLNKKGACSLMENFFILKYKKLAQKMIKFNSDELKNKTIITSCNLTKWGLVESFKLAKINARVITYSEFINSLKK